MSQFHLIEDMLGDSTRPVARNTIKKGGRAGTTTRKPPTGSSGGGRRAIAALVTKKPEVMVKITGFGKHAVGITKNLLYNSRGGELDLEGEDGRVVSGRDDVIATAKQWARHSSHRRPNQRDTMNLVVSMPPGTNAGAVKAAAREFARATFAANHDYLFVQHTDEPQPHVHFSIRMRGHDRTRLNPRKADLQAWRETFAECLREQGIACSATPRRARGVVLKPERQVLRHMRQKAQALRQRGEKAGHIIVDRKAIDEAFVELKARGARKPWEAQILKTQQRIRENYLRAAEALIQSPDRGEQQLAADLKAFVRDMPPLKTRRHLLREQIADHLHQSADPAQDRIPTEHNR